jgi:hypothetical protein
LQGDTCIEPDIAVGQHRDVTGAMQTGLAHPVQIGRSAGQPNDTQPVIIKWARRVVVLQQIDAGKGSTIQITFEAIQQFCCAVAILGCIER